MKTVLAITDLTRMQEGRVCIAGYDAVGKCVRPVTPPPGLMESALYSQGRPIAFPFAVAEMELVQPRPQPPHTEDVDFDPNSLRLLDRLDEKHAQAELTRSLYPSVAAIFETPILTDPGHYVREGQGPRSLGTVRPRYVIKTIHEMDAKGKWKYRLGFIDGAGKSYWLTITDLTWRYSVDHHRRAGLSPEEISAELTAMLHSCRVLLRIGLARGWPEYPGCCFLQITGIYTVPDYTRGQTFADLAPPENGGGPPAAPAG